MQRTALRYALAGCLAAAAMAQTVTLTLSSPQDGQVVAPGATVNWTIRFTVSTGDNQGLALLSVDLVQDPANPATIDIPPADGVPAGMSNFSRPDGISNPGESDPVTGYIGVQRGTPGAMNLIQIGGGQNTFGQALPSGTGVAENANVVAGVGQSGPQELASGSFTLPGTGCGTYTFSLANAVANVLTQVNSPPNFSPVAAATVDTTAGSITITVGLAGDLNGDGVVDLTDLSTLLSNFGGPGGAADGDINGDGVVDLTDLSALLGNFGSSCP